eukprot:748746-Hanusia_phi.AAC.2
MAQGLAEKASAGMKAAKVYFGRAIGEREDAVKAAGQAAKDVVDAASVSLAGNKEEEERRVLRKVVEGEEHGKKAMKDILTADSKAVDEAERELGQAKQEVSSSERFKKKLSDRMLEVQEHIDVLHRQFHAAQADVVAAAKAHVLASKKLEEATAANLRAQTQLDKMRKDEVDTLKRELKEAQGAQLESSSKFEEASRRLEGINGRRTALEVQISRLKLELQREKMKKEDEVNKAKTTDMLNKRLERTLEEEKVALKEAKIELAMKGRTLSDQKGKRGRGEDRHGAVDRAEEEGEEEEPGYHSALAREMRRQASMQTEFLTATLTTFPTEENGGGAAGCRSLCSRGSGEHCEGSGRGESRGDVGGGRERRGGEEGGSQRRGNTEGVGERGNKDREEESREDECKRGEERIRDEKYIYLLAILSHPPRACTPLSYLVGRLPARALHAIVVLCVFLLPVSGGCVHDELNAGKGRSSSQRLRRDVSVVGRSTAPRVGGTGKSREKRWKEGIQLNKTREGADDGGDGDCRGDEDDCGGGGNDDGNDGDGDEDEEEGGGRG